MSRNLGETTCHVCDADKVYMVEATRPLTGDDAGVYFDKYTRGMMVANAECADCDTKYLAWVTDPHGNRTPPWEGHGFYDLSYRSTFNDEPGPADVALGWDPKKLRARLEEAEKSNKELRHAAQLGYGALGDVRKAISSEHDGRLQLALDDLMLNAQVALEKALMRT